MLRTEQSISEQRKHRVRALGEWGAICGRSVAAGQKWREMLLVTQAKGHVGPGLGHAEVRQAGRGRDLLADVLPSEDDAAGLAFEAADVPLLVQRQERLAMLDLLLAPSAVCKDRRTR